MKSFFLVLFFASLLNAQYLTFQPTYNLSNSPSATSDYEAVYSDNNRYYVVWQDNGEIKFKSSSDFGATWTPNLTIASSATTTMGWPVVAASYNYVYVLYHQNPGDYEIIFHYSTNFGQTWSSGQIISGMDIGAITPQLYVNNMGHVYAVWEQKINNYYDIILRRSTDQGLTWLPEQNISNTPTLNSRWVQIQGNWPHVYIAWIDQSTYPLGDIYIRKSVDNGATWDGALNVTNDARPQNRFFMKSYYDNIYIAADDIPGNFNFDEIYLLKSTNEGYTWSSSVNITNNPGHSNTPCIEVYGSNILFTWSDNTQSAPAYDNSDIFFKWSSDGGVTWRDSLNLSVNPETSSRPRICFGYNGPIGNGWTEISVIWYDYSTGDAELLARKGILFPTPVELVSFNAECADQNVLLKWSTATEKNNRGFELSRKNADDADASWQSITFISGNGTTTEQIDYSYVDAVPHPGSYIYRLTQKDFDGTTTILRETIADVGSPGKFELYQNYPNPFNPETKIKYTVNVPAFVNISVYDILGNRIKEIVNELKNPGTYNLRFNGNELSSGIYYYKMISGSFVSVKKMLLIK